MGDPDRRGLLLGAAAVLGSAGAASAGALAPTPPNELGPFYKRGAPHDAVLVRPGDAGSPLRIVGVVFRSTGEALPGARIELWHTDDDGHYDVAGDHFRADLAAGASGAYAVRTIMPGHYPDRVCQHVHFLVRAAGCKPLITQMYFASDPVFEGDPDRNFTRDPLILSRELVRPVVLVKDGADHFARVNFELVLEAL
jgi:protocatechuate 3,4-dioxygenase beta subunit